jgi:crotonobetainyl-CoA:carnitine CoA-transferase CaiB-like acyl-CoA transferase
MTLDATGKRDEMPGILDGIRVLDLSQFLAGPHTTLLMAGMGAEVIRIDNPKTGDALSGSPFFVGPKGVSIEKQDSSDLGIAFLKRCRAKKSITLDLKSAEGHALFMRLVEKADVLVENFSVGVTKRLKIDWPSLQSVNPKLVYCSITGYGAFGPDSGLRGYDVTTQAMSGLMSVTGRPGEPPTKAGSPLADTISAGFALSGILGALFHCQRTGIGQFVDVSMVDILFSLLFDEPFDCYANLGLKHQQGNRVMRFSPFNTYPTTDGWMVIGCGTDAMWKGICAVIGRTDLAEDANWSRMSWRVAHNEEVDELLTEWSQAQAANEAIAQINAAGAVASAVHGIDDLLQWPHLKARGMIDSLTHPELGVIPNVHAAGFPLKFSATQTGYEMAAAPCGAHNHEVYGELLGLRADEIDELSSRSIL